MPFTSNGDVRLHWREDGPPDAASGASPVLLVMGHRYSSAMWYPIVSALTAGRRVVWFDNRGTGESGYSRDVTIEDLAADAFAVMDAAGVQQACLFGASMGGVIVQEMMRQRPDRAAALILGCTWIPSPEKPRPPTLLRVLYYLPPWLAKMLMPKRRGGHGYGSAADPAAVAQDMAMLAKDKSVSAGVVAQAKAMSRYRLGKEAVAAMNKPALVMHGDEDSVVPFPYGEELAATLPDSRFVRMHGAGHNFLVARKAETIEAVTRFLDEVDRT